MSKPRKYGTQRAYTPNFRADSRRRKVWEHNRRVAERPQGKRRKRREERRKLSGVDDI